jgi:hypothetical protein
MMLCNLFKANRSFGEKYHLHLHDPGVRQERKQYELDYVVPLKDVPEDVTLQHLEFLETSVLKSRTTRSVVPTTITSRKIVQHLDKMFISGYCIINIFVK